jgi:hypothetical protein
MTRRQWALEMISDFVKFLGLYTRGVDVWGTGEQPMRK